MPGKDRRIAARQAQIRERRKKQGRGPSGIPSAEMSLDDGAGTAVSISDGAASAPSAIQTAVSSGSVSVRPDGFRRNIGRPQPAPPPANASVGPELRRILVLTSVIFVILIIITVVLNR